MISAYNVTVLLFYAAGFAAAGALELIAKLWLALWAGLPLATKPSERRAWIWLAVGASSYIGTVLYWNADLPFPEMVSACVDFCVAASVFVFAFRNWERIVFLAFQLCLVVNWIHHMGMSEAYANAVVLEIINMALAVFIGANSAYERAGIGNAWLHSPWRSVFGFARPFWGIEREAVRTKR